MNNDSNITNSTNPSDEALLSPGHQLRNAREGKNITIETAAQQLHLSKNLLVALENDDYTNIGAIVYAYGYLRSYAKLLNIDDAPIVAAFERLRAAKDFTIGLNNKQGEKLAKNHARQQRTAEQGAHRTSWIWYVAAILAVVAIILWWQNRELHADSTEGTAVSTTTTSETLPIKDAGTLPQPQQKVEQPTTIEKTAPISTTPAENSQDTTEAPTNKSSAKKTATNKTNNDISTDIDTSDEVDTYTNAPDTSKKTSSNDE